MPEIRDSAVSATKDFLVRFRERKSLFELAWRAALFLLPWQTRWFDGQDLAGWPWEQGRWSVYLVWLPMLIATYLGWSYRERKIEKKTRIYLGFGLAALVAVTVIGVASGVGLDAIRLKAVAATQWWVQCALIAGFFFTLWSTKISREKVLGWFVLSLLPVVALSYIQFVMQQVVGSKWLGVANHDPRELGVSVVEFGEFRLLRIYGSMPHPNILGGWLALGIVAAAISAYRSVQKNAALFWSFSASLVAGSLILTFSRAAYLAAAVGVFFTAGLFFLRRKSDAAAFQFGMLALCLAASVAGVVAYTQREPIMTRVQDQGRLEVKSLSQRGESVKDGLTILRQHIFFGSGVNAEQVDIAMQSADEKGEGLVGLVLREPIESPHNSFLLLLVGFGVFGGLIFVFLAVLLARQRTDFIYLPLLASLIVVLWFDHYGISYWSGVSLVALVLSVFIGNDPDSI